MAGKDVVSDAAEREHVEAGALRRVGPGGFAREVHQARVFGEFLHMAGADGAVNRVGRGRSADVARRGLPVHQSQRQGAGVSPLHQHALWPQSGVVEPLGVGVLERFGQVAHELQALGDGEALALFAQELVEPDGLGVVFEDLSRTKFGFLVVVDAQNARVVDAFEDFKLASRLAQPHSPGFWSGGRGQRVHPDPAVHCLDAHVPGCPVLEALAFGHQPGELVIAHLAVLVGRADARLDDGSANGPGLDDVHRQRCLLGDAVAECRDDASVVQRAGAAVPERGALGQPFELAREAGGREKDGRLHERQADLGLDDRRLPTQQAGQPLGLVRLARISGLSQVDVRPSVVEVQVWTSPRRVTGRLLISIRKRPAGDSTRAST